MKRSGKSIETRDYENDEPSQLAFFFLYYRFRKPVLYSDEADNRISLRGRPLNVKVLTSTFPMVGR